MFNFGASLIPNTLKSALRPAVAHTQDFSSSSFAFHLWASNEKKSVRGSKILIGSGIEESLLGPVETSMLGSGLSTST